MDDRLHDFARFVFNHPGVASDEVARHFSVSTRSVRTWTHKANESLRGIATISSNRGFLSVEVTDEVAWRHMADPSSFATTPLDPDSDRRFEPLAARLLLGTNWMTLDELSGKFFVGRRALSEDLREIEDLLKTFGLALERRPHYGIRVTGPEFSRRLAIARITASDRLREDRLPEFVDLLNAESRNAVATIATCIDDALAQSGIRLSAVRWQNLLVHVTVAVQRVKDGCFVSMTPEQLAHAAAPVELDCAATLAELLGERLNVRFPEQEVAYLAIHLASKRAIGSMEGTSGEQISDEIWSLVLEMLLAVREAFHIDLTGDLELRMNLARHVAPLAIRLQYGMDTSNPMLAEIKANFPLALSMAGVAAHVLEQQLGKMPSESETGYLALEFALALERQQDGPEKKRVLVVCASGQAGARLLEHRFRREFGEQLESVVVCDVAHVASQDFSRVDYVFTTVPLQVPVPVPVREIRYFLDDSDKAIVREALRDKPSHAQGAEALFAEQRFFAHVTATSKTKVLDLLCAAAWATGWCDANFRELVDAREETMPTSFGNRVAMPHPLHAAAAETFSCVALLDRPIVWDKHGTEVQAVFLIAYGHDAGTELDDIFAQLADLFVSEDRISRLLADQQLQVLVKLLKA